MKGKFNQEGFELIEQLGSITASEFAQRFWISRGAARTWLSKWTNYNDKMRGVRKHFLVHDRSGKGEGTYRLGPDWWGERAFKGARYE